MATFTALEPPLPPGAVAPPKPPGLVGGPGVLARNFAVMTGVNAGLQCAIKKARGGKEDVQGSMAASFGAGAAFSLVSAIGAPVRASCSKAYVAPHGGWTRANCYSANSATNHLLTPHLSQAAAAPAALLADAVRTGAVFSLLQGAFYQIGNMFSGGKKTPEQDYAFAHTTAMLNTLGLQRFEKNFRKGELDDLTLPLLTDSALKEARIPPGPRLRILQFSAYQRSVAAAARPNQAVGHMSLALPI